MGDKKIYPYLPEGREFRFVRADDPFMLEAQKARDALSTDKKFPTGSVVVRSGIVVGAGANKSALTNPKLIAFHKDVLCVRRFFGVKSGQKYWLCPGCGSHANHSERLALKDAKQRGANTNGADLYLYGHWWCCKPCWDTMIAAGIRDVYLLENSRELWG